MKYFEVEFTISPYSADAADLFASLAGEAGFETFEETETGLKGYVQQSLFDEDALRECIEDFPFEGTSIIYNVREAEDRDWNEQWEQEGFEPIVIADQLVIHDGRHLPEVDSKVQIEIDAKLAFGTGTHETTRMICTQLLKLAKGRVLDCGTGTGILSICALKLGATEAVGYDIDEWSVDNARHNAVINRVDDRFTSLLGDAKILENIDEKFDIVLANINRNILLADMPMFVSKMHEGSLLILSGFYSDDCEILIEKAHSIGLKLVSKTTDHDWACLVLKH
ncbi:MAG: 50S ribosomal protein L11 methyltransferase [Prevotella sp.]|jgi:ribosomal protein L11 methyltransferase|uniref:Ribosomal protein L11 methyltransferase n=1 Tax=Xylanibacter ruminicola TaxID=839 RepID=A0A1M7DAX8_XYLRU|nr:MULTISPECIES: 50S ribosomal protein L11 methyltransferase [Prevotellaceae]MBO4895764.1 50S ribosomal protein L11 methyltransferase [Prevotella sp.]MBP3246677.1 50S ribosomal protein L11 methyltransferase [Prevotella sp.]MBQ6917117.1 50S ribosomal protein L11 methyltransferase [Prevotella sp.]SFB92199.1 ribosomal protein L11 methyltransferase [Xylanibacter ruminicola]SHL76605.1 ribosomal protein L11 methyltransferase [Xylanibacter ruminicola]